MSGNTEADFNKWLARVKVATKHSEIFHILDEFRPFDWTDEQRSEMAKLYIRCLDSTEDDVTGGGGGDGEQS